MSVGLVEGKNWLIELKRTRVVSSMAGSKCSNAIRNVSPAFNSVSQCGGFILSQHPQGATSTPSIHLTTLEAPWKICPFPTVPTKSVRLTFHWLGWVTCLPLDPGLGPRQRTRGQPPLTHMDKERGSADPKESGCFSQEKGSG